MLFNILQTFKGSDFNRITDNVSTFGKKYGNGNTRTYYRLIGKLLPTPGKFDIDKAPLSVLDLFWRSTIRKVMAVLELVGYPVRPSGK